MSASPVPRKRVPCRKCGRGVLVAAYAGAYPVFIRCAACYRDASLPTPLPVRCEWRDAA